MEHMLKVMRVHYEIMLCYLAAEWRSGQYRKISDCPAYAEVYTIIKSMNVIRACLEWPKLKISDEVKGYAWGEMLSNRRNYLRQSA